MFINFKPDIIKALIRYFTESMKSQQKSAQKSDNLKNSIQQEVELAKVLEEKIKQLTNTDIIEVNLNVSLNQVTLRLIHQQTHVCIAELSLKDIKSNIVMRQGAMEVAAKLSNLQVLDTTNYPFTVDSNIEWEKIVPYEILGVGSSGESLLDLTFNQYDPSSSLSDRENRIFSYAKVNLSRIRVNYLQQPVLRIIDFLTNQLATIGQTLPPSSEQIEQNSAEIAAEKKQLLNLAIFNLKYPMFMDLDISVISPIINLKPLPTSKEYLQISLGDIKIKNKQQKTLSRVKNGGKLLDSTWVETMYIDIHNMGLSKIIEDNIYKVSENFEFKIEFERALFAEEYARVYEELTVDSSMILKGFMTPIIIILSKDDYALIMKGLNFNVTYDDLMDDMLTMKLATPIKVDPAQVAQGGLSLNIALDFQNLSLLIKESEAPSAMVNLHLMKIRMIKNDDGLILDLWAKDLNGSYFESSEVQQNIIERRMLGKLDKVNVYDKGKDILHKVVNNIRNFVNEIINQDMKDSKEKQGKLVLGVNRKATGSMDIRAILDELKVYLAIAALLKLATFAQLDGSVNPPPPKGAYIQASPTGTFILFII